VYSQQLAARSRVGGRADCLRRDVEIVARPPTSTLVPGLAMRRISPVALRRKFRSRSFACLISFTPEVWMSGFGRRKIHTTGCAPDRDNEGARGPAAVEQSPDEAMRVRTISRPGRHRSSRCSPCPLAEPHLRRSGVVVQRPLTPNHTIWFVHDGGEVRRGRGGGAWGRQGSANLEPEPAATWGGGRGKGTVEAASGRTCEPAPRRQHADRLAGRRGATARPGSSGKSNVS